MKLKYPKTLKIGSTIFNMKYDNKSSGGSFKYPFKGEPAELCIGTKCPVLTQLDILIHELSEIIHHEQGTRFEGTTIHEDYLFCYRHDQHSNFCSMLAGCLDEFIK